MDGNELVDPHILTSSRGMREKHCCILHRPTCKLSLSHFKCRSTHEGNRKSARSAPSATSCEFITPPATSREMAVLCWARDYTVKWAWQRQWSSRPQKMSGCSAFPPLGKTACVFVSSAAVGTFYRSTKSTGIVNMPEATLLWSRVI